MTLPLAAPPAVLGAQTPRILHVPEFVSSTGEEAVELAAMAGLELDPWQQFVLVNALGERADGQWAAFEVGVEVPRQNGKGGILEARELAGLFLLGEGLLIHSAHEFSTSLEAFHRLLALIEGCDDLARRVRRVSRAHGDEGITLKSGQRIRYRTRTKGGGRGFSADWVGLDEAMYIPEAMHGALLPVLSARPNPQVFYTGSAVDKLTMEHGIVFARLRDRAIRGVDPGLAYFGWSPPVDRPDDLSAGQSADPDVWAQANPGLGIRITAEHIALEQRSMDARTFAVERLGVGDWPDPEGEPPVIDLNLWLSLMDSDSQLLDPVCFAFDVTPVRGTASIGVAAKRADGLFHVERLEHRPGTGWLPGRLAELTKAHAQIGRPLCDGASPAASLIPELEQLGVQVETINAKEHAQSCGLIFDLVEQQKLRHLGQPELVSALKGAAKRPLGDAWAWSRKTSKVDISPLVACTLALWGVGRRQARVPLIGSVSR